MVKIAFVIDTIFSPHGGTEKQLLLLLRNLEREKFSPYLCLLRSSEWFDRSFDLCPFSVLDINSFKYPGSYYRIWKFANFLKREEIDIVQTHFRDANMVGVLAGRIAGTRVVISTRRNQGYWLNRKELIIQKFLNRWVGLFIANSYSTKNWVSETEGIPSDKIQVIYNGLEVEPFIKNSPEDRQRYRKSLGISDDSPAIGIVANLRPVKAIDVFLRAARIVKKELPKARFIIVGEGPEDRKLVGLSAELGLRDSVNFLGVRNDVVSILGALDLGVLSSYSESFSNSIIEYLAAGLPVVCTDVGGAQEAIEEGVNGFVVPVGDYKAMASRIVKILKEGLPGLRKSKNLEKIKDKFLLSKTIAIYKKTYLNLLGDDC